MIRILAALALFSQDVEQLSEATVAPVFGEGSLRGCTINFKSVQRDNLYFGGRPVGADGSFNVYHFGQGRVGAMLKVAVLDGLALRLPDTSYLIAGYATNAADLTANMAAEDAGYMLSTFAFGAPTVDAITHFMDDASISVGVQMNGGSSAIPFRTDLTDEQVGAWASCMERLVTDAQSALGGSD